MKYLIILSIFIVSCNPCKHIAKHPECFPADTIRLTDKIIHYEKEYIINDSIIFDSIPCDPVENFIYKTRTVYKTNFKLKVDTIYQLKETSRINPVNIDLKKQNERLSVKMKLRNRIIIGSSILLLLLGVIIYIK